MSKLNVWDWIALVLAIIGAVNWGLVGAFQLDLVETVFGQMTAWSRIIYVLVGLAGLYLIFVASKLSTSE